MKTFKEFYESVAIDSILSYPSSFSEMRNKIKEDSFEESYFEGGTPSFVRLGIQPIHTSDTLRHREKLSPEDEKYVHFFTSGKSGSTGIDGKWWQISSGMNTFLRNLSGSKDIRLYGDAHKEAIANPDIVKDNIRHLSSLFIPGRSNHGDVTAYSGVPGRVGRILCEGGKNSTHLVPGFISMTTMEDKAYSFGTGHADDGNIHLLHIHIPSGSRVMSVVHHALYAHENEITADHGHYMKYHGSIIYPKQSNKNPEGYEAFFNPSRKTKINPKPLKNISYDDDHLIVHHVTLMPKQKSVDDYQGSYS